MARRLNDSDWAKFRGVINDIHEDFNQETLLWKRHNPTMVSLFNEGLENNYQDIPLKVLVGYNNFRTWPITKHNGGEGEIDNQNMVVYINIKYLEDNGYINQDGYFDFNPANDKFILNGIAYKGEGDTNLSQAFDKPLLFLLVLRREAESTGKSRY